MTINRFGLLALLFAQSLASDTIAQLVAETVRAVA